MDYSAATSWGLFGAAVVAGCYYYWPEGQRRPEKTREHPKESAPSRKKRQEQDGKARSNTPGQTKDRESGQQSGSDSTRKRKQQPQQKQQPQPSQPAAPKVAVHDNEPEEVDMSTKQWAQQMMDARKGKDLGSKNTQEQRVKTVKQGRAVNGLPQVSSGSSQTGAEADDDLSPTVSTQADAGDVSDMLEPTAKGPSTLRVMPSTQPQKQKTQRQPKTDEVETKKQRQNRQKIEERRIEREAEEKDRKALEEKQRRSAREARGEPAKNGIPASKPASSAWSGPKAAPVNGNSAAPTMNGSANAPLLDTFDADSIATSAGGAVQAPKPTASEEDQMAQAMKESEDASGWTTVAQPKKQQKKKGDEDTNTENAKPAPAPAVVAPAVKPAAAPKMVNGKPKGFQALDVQYEQRATVDDPTDASNWDA